MTNDQCSMTKGRCLKLRWRIVAAVLVCCLAGWVAGCKENAAPTISDPLLERAAPLRVVALSTFDAWLFIEHQNRELYRTNFAEAHEYSERVRTNAANLLRFLDQATTAQKVDPNEKNRRALATAIAIVESHLRVCQNYIVEADQKSEGKR